MFPGQNFIKSTGTYVCLGGQLGGAVRVVLLNPRLKQSYIHGGNVAQCSTKGQAKCSLLFYRLSRICAAWLHIWRP